MENCLVGNQDFVAYPYLISFLLCQISLKMGKLLLYNIERKQFRIFMVWWLLKIRNNYDTSYYHHILILN